jgi:hypothetical protein
MYILAQLKSGLTLQPDRQLHDRPAACVIAQQYSSATCASLRCHTRKAGFGVSFKNIITFFFYFLQVA